ncbi:Peptidoglycan/xylan/chitin deacetylase, PgdA/CDA1 family [Reichenbachiella faecimaris]|uniref:Peptidoglycan/xylan/chitin deacetylase, PgdA/CDA1 family n=1 Tax=Reichenbachiella faecimaris TaxID=692418 RepID=A0A1W2G796_REIFA|nr:polysaccharide deacetylase family protein [Reichenbachiella faecimaris]SMD32176.1 Peptidoglycan/xylan/chitin deacetylase, PgdA/CDA1 family [Reichenbachiella faecimaris]
MTKYQITRLFFFAILLGSVVLVYLAFVSWWIIGVVVIFYASLMFYFSMNIRTGFFLDAICEMPGEKVMLTFDDGPDTEHTPQILDILKENEVSAFFFLIGNKAEQYPEIVKRMIDEGHQIGGHSYQHLKWFGLMGKQKVNDEIMSAQKVLAEIAGKPVHWFRPPFGVTNPNVSACVRQNGLKMIGWNVRSFDTAMNDANILENRMCSRIASGSVVLMHDRLAQTVEALPGIIAHVKAQGLEFDVLRENDNQNL